MFDRVRAKFFVSACEAVAASANQPGPQGNVTLKAVSRGAENSSWASATPTGTLTMYVSNPSGFAWMQSRLGKEVYMDFTDVDPSIYDPTNHEFIEHPYKGVEGMTSYYTERCAQCGGTEDEHKPKQS